MATKRSGPVCRVLVFMPQGVYDRLVAHCGLGRITRTVIQAVLEYLDRVAPDDRQEPREPAATAL